MRDDGGLQVVVRVDPSKAGLIEAKFSADAAHASRRKTKSIG
jgi:hypothetical protein